MRTLCMAQTAVRCVQDWQGVTSAFLSKSRALPAVRELPSILWTNRTWSKCVQFVVLNTSDMKRHVSMIKWLLGQKLFLCFQIFLLVFCLSWTHHIWVLCLWFYWWNPPATVIMPENAESHAYSQNQPQLHHGNHQRQCPFLSLQPKVRTNRAKWARIHYFVIP